MRIRIAEVSERITRLIPKVGIGFRDDRVSQGFGEILWICLTKRDVTTGRVVWRKCKNDIPARAIIDARGLEQKSIRWVEEGWKNLRRREAARQTHVGECRYDDQRGN